MNRSALLAPLAGALLAAALPQSALALDLTPTAMSVEGGTTEDRVDADRFGFTLRWDLAQPWFTVGDWRFVSYLEAGVNYWDSTDGRSGEDSLVDFHLTPVFRYEMKPGGGAIAPFIEGGVGVHLYTEDALNDKEFDIPFAFGSHLGVGARFGQNGEYELMYRYQHQSNAGLGDENPGINFHLVSLGVHF
ncbi:MAG: acyloxyacyl hydrolase [Gammaproteobacteria bacterium]